MEARWIWTTEPCGISLWDWRITSGASGKQVSIMSASEIMAILCLSDNLEDLKDDWGKYFLFYTFQKKPIYARDLKVEGAMAALLKEAIKPNLVQTIEGNPAHSRRSFCQYRSRDQFGYYAARMGMSLADYTVTEAGFGADLGAEKFWTLNAKAQELHQKQWYLQRPFGPWSTTEGTAIRLNNPNRMQWKGIAQFGKTFGKCETVRHYAHNCH